MSVKKELGRVGMLVLVMPGLLGIAQAQDAQWDTMLAAYVFGAGMEGQVGARGQVADIDASFGDLLENLEFSFAAAVLARKGRWAISGDFNYVGLGTSTKLLAQVDMDQYIVGGDVSYEVGPHFDVLGGLRFVSLDGKIEFRDPVPIVREADKDWIDPVVGIRWAPPLSEKWSLLTRFDIGGFGAGSDFTWQLHGHALWSITDKAGLAFGYRAMGFDYEEGEGSDRFVFDTTISGPSIAMLLRF
jgi:hypothetical protein